MKITFLYVLGVIGVIMLFIPSGYFMLTSFGSSPSEIGTVAHKLFWSTLFLDSLVAGSALILLKEKPSVAGKILLAAGAIVFILFGTLLILLNESENLFEFAFSIFGVVFFIPALLYIFIGTFILRRLQKSLSTMGIL